ncbi:MAG TPA: hypothetical protein VM389_11800, partial [Phycisphaerae bacterium]|nr:hypothetical protein [Phycisphaerae bacterium]
MKKLLVRGIVVLLVLVIVLGIVGYILLDVIAKKGVEEGGTYALGVQTRLNSLSLSPFSGTLAMDGLNVANPAGYKSPHLMHSGTFDLEVVPSSILDDTIQVRKFELNGLSLNVEQKGLGKSNISEVLDNLKRLGGEEKPDEKKPEEEKGKKVKVDRIVIRNVSATFHLPAINPLSVKVPEIKLENITSDNAEG